MIQTQTIVDVVDNSGAKSLRCIKVFGGFKKAVWCFRKCYKSIHTRVTSQKQ